MRRYVEARHLRGERRAEALETAFALFSERSIEAVSMTDVADASKMGVATVYRYYGTKKDLVIEAAASRWYKTFYAYHDLIGKEAFRSMRGIEQIRCLLNLALYLYDEHRDLLRFSSNLDQYLHHEGVTVEEVAEATETFAPFIELVPRVFDLAIQQGDVDPRFASLSIQYGGMLSLFAAAQKYACGRDYCFGSFIGPDFDGRVCLQNQIDAYMVSLSPKHPE